MLRSFDPTAGYTTELALVWDTLLEWESTWYFPEAQTKPMTRKSLVESWEMVDPLTWIFHLRKGVKFHNVPPVHGREMVAEDVRYSYELPPPPRRRVCQSVYNRHLMRLNQSLTLAAACTRGLHQSQSGLLLAVCSLATVSRCDRAHAGLRALPHAQRGSGSERPQSGWLRSAAGQPVPGRTGASAGLRPACDRQGARPAAWRGLGEVSGGAGGDGHALGERTSGRAAGGHAGDGRGQWQRPFEFPILSRPSHHEGSLTMREDTTKRVRELVDAVYRSASRHILATLIRLLGDFDAAEEALHEAFAVAVEQWSRHGVPANPRAWLISTGRFKAIDGMRRRARCDASLTALARQLESSTSDAEAWRIGNSNGLLAPPRRRRPPQPPPPAAPLGARLLGAAQSAAAASPERPGARRSTALRGVGWCWTGAAGWGRVARRDALE
jgi:hypothetical protein